MAFKFPQRVSSLSSIAAGIFWNKVLTVVARCGELAGSVLHTRLFRGEITCGLGFHWLTLLLFIVLTSSHFIGQDTASLTGTVTDPANAVVTNARVTVTNLGNGVYRMTGTNSAGEYLVSGFPPARYDVAIAASGLAKHEVKDLVLGSRTEGTIGCQVTNR